MSQSTPETSLPPAIFLMGPTASGKTGLAVQLAKCLPVEIISVDSAMVYRGMDIGTAKPGPELLCIAPHRLIDIRDPSEPYSAAEFRADALAEMAKIARLGRIPLLVGGTMLYFRALERGLSALPAADPLVRARLEAEARSLGWQALHARLARVDPVAAGRIHANDPQRVQRALEVYELTGLPLSVLQAQGQAEALPYRLIKLVLAPADRAVLHERIERRFYAMLDEGLLEEVRCLLERKDLDAELPAMRAVGYRQARACLEGRIDYDQMVNQAIVATRQYAKRQLTWLRSEPETQWFEGSSGAAIRWVELQLRDWLKEEK